MRLLVDGDLLVYRAGFAAEKGEYILTYTNAVGDEILEAYTYKKDVTSRLENLGSPPHSIEFNRVKEPVENALHNVKSLITTFQNELKSDDVTVFLSGPTNFRMDLAKQKPYKGNRDPAHKPQHGPAIKEYIEKHWPTVWSVDEEADDVLGYTQYPVWENLETVIVSTDKDLDMIPGLHYNFLKNVAYNVSQKEADMWFWRQMLTGDPTDNIPGVPGIGDKIASKLLKDVKSNEEAYNLVYAKYQEVYEQPTPEDPIPGSCFDVLLEQARLLWIRRKPEQMWELSCLIN